MEDRRQRRMHGLPEVCSLVQSLMMRGRKLKWWRCLNFDMSCFHRLSSLDFTFFFLCSNTCMEIRPGTCHTMTSSTRSWFCSPTLTMRDLFHHWLMVRTHTSYLSAVSCWILFLFLKLQWRIFLENCSDMYCTECSHTVLLTQSCSNDVGGVCVFAGLKPGQRKVLFTCMKRNDKREVKVAQLAGSVAEMSAYHHGEVQSAH